MGFEKVALFGLLDLDMECTGSVTITLWTDLPGNALAVRETHQIGAAFSRSIRRFRLLGTTKGHLYKLRVQPDAASTLRLYRARIWARSLPGTVWAWYVVPVISTPDEWVAKALPIPGLSEWGAHVLPIPQMGEFAPVKLPIPDMGDWGASKLPIQPTPEFPQWVELQVDQ